LSILVTGGAGYIGSHTCVELLDMGFEIVVVDNLMNSKIEAIHRVRELTGKEFPFYQVDLLDREGLEKVFHEHSIEAVIHFAGLKAVGQSVAHPLFYYHNNITGTLVLCEVMQQYTVHKLVFSSSATVYGMPEEVPIHEYFPLSATNPYGQTKLMIEQILQDLYISDHRWSISALRYFNPVGAHASGRIGEDPNGLPNNLMPYISQVAIGKHERLSVFGNDYPTIDGTGVRDYIHVDDLAKGHLKALEKVRIGSGMNCYNLGTGQGYSVLEMIAAFEKVSEKAIPYILEARRLGDVAICYADTTKAREQLDWVAVKGIEEMCVDAWRWQINNPNGYEG
jgi:UDP-glucose 4-epimerase